MSIALEKEQTFYALTGTSFMPADQIIEVIEVQVREIVNPGTFTSLREGLYKVGENAFRERSAAYERALAAQGHRVALATDSRRKHLEQWEVLIQEFGHEMPAEWDRENFAAWEFKCRHGLSVSAHVPEFLDQVGAPCEQHMDLWFIERLQLSRKIAGIPYNINSGWRCEVWNEIVGGSPDSSHMRGLAADIAVVTSQQRYTIMGALIQAGFKRIGIREDFIHVDADPEKEQGLIWLY